MKNPIFSIFTKNEDNVDKYNLREVIMEYLDQAELGQKVAAKIKIKKKDFSNVIIAGMGGSALPGGLLIDYLDNQERDFNLPVYITRDYHLPSRASADSLIFISSYSGNTEEIVSCFHEALELRASIIAISSGGEIEKIARKKSVPHVKLKIDKEGFQPRYAAIYFFMAMQQILTNLGLSDRISDLPKSKKYIRDLEVKGEEIAGKAKNKTPVFYASNRFKSVVRHCKIKVNENAKTPAFWNYFPEVNHNEMVGFTNPQGQFFVVMFENIDDHSQVKKRMKVTSNLYKEKGVKSEIVKVKGESYLEKCFYMLLLGDWISYYLALEYGQDPTPVDMVEDLKKALK